MGNKGMKRTFQNIVQWFRFESILTIRVNQLSLLSWSQLPTWQSWLPELSDMDDVSRVSGAQDAPIDIQHLHSIQEDTTDEETGTPRYEEILKHEQVKGYESDESLDSIATSTRYPASSVSSSSEDDIQVPSAGVRNCNDKKNDEGCCTQEKDESSKCEPLQDFPEPDDTPSLDWDLGGLNQSVSLPENDRIQVKKNQSEDLHPGNWDEDEPDNPYGYESTTCAHQEDWLLITFRMTQARLLYNARNYGWEKRGPELKPPEKFWWTNPNKEDVPAYRWRAIKRHRRDQFKNADWQDLIASFRCLSSSYFSSSYNCYKPFLCDWRAISYTDQSLSWSIIDQNRSHIKFF